MNLLGWGSAVEYLKNVWVLVMTGSEEYGTIWATTLSIVFIAKSNERDKLLHMSEKLQNDEDCKTCRNKHKLRGVFKKTSV